MDAPDFDSSAWAAAAAAGVRDDSNVTTTCLLKEVIMTRLSELQTCKESMPEEGRTAYSVFVLCFQFLLPMITLSAAYYQVYICFKQSQSKVAKLLLLQICRTLKLRLEQRMRQRQANAGVDAVSSCAGGGGSTTAVLANVGGRTASGKRGRRASSAGGERDECSKRCVSQPFLE